jgi:tetratricopeptide (TPR) repeat protein
MRTILGAAAFAAILALANPAVARDTQPRLPASATSPMDEGLLLAFGEANDHIQRQEYIQAYAVLEALTAKPAFQADTSEARYATWLLMAGVAGEARDWPKARTAIEKATAFPEAGASDWQIRVRIARASGDMAEGLRSIAVIARRFPDGLALFSDEELGRWLDAAKLETDQTLAFDFADALLTHWTPSDPFVEPFVERDEMRQIQVEGLLRQGRTAQAIEVTRKISKPDVLVAMRADKRFDALSAADPGLLDPKSAALRQLAGIDALYSAHPDLLSGVDARTSALLDLDRGEEALAVVEAAIIRAQKDPRAFKDADSRLAWTINLKNLALGSLGRDEEALEALETAARVPEKGKANVNQTLNLAAQQMNMGRFKAALATVNSVRDDRVSPYGKAVGLRITVCSATLLGDLRTADEALRQLRDLKLEAKRQLEDALLCRGDMDGAAAMLIERLQSPIQRNLALFGLQVTPLRPSPLPLDVTLRKRRAELRARSDVHAAIDAVGRVITYGPEDLWPPKPVVTTSSTAR